MTAHRVGSAAYYRSRQAPIVKVKDRPRRISERSRDWEAEAAREWVELYLPELVEVDADCLLRASTYIQAELAAGRVPVVSGIPPQPVKNARRRTVDPLVCPRCEQRFRFATGRAWHVANRVGPRSCVPQEMARAS